MPISLRANLLSRRKLPTSEAALMGRIEMLPDQDRALMEAVLVRGASAEVAARMVGAKSCVIRARVRRLSRRISSYDFVEVVRSLPYLHADDALMARLFYCEGLSQRRIGWRLGLSPHLVRRRLDRVRGQVATMRQGRHNPMRSREEQDSQQSAFEPTGT